MATRAIPRSAIPAFGAPARTFLVGLDYKWQVLLCTVVGTFMVMLDQTVVNIALPKITTVFGVSVLKWRAKPRTTSNIPGFRSASDGYTEFPMCRNIKTLFNFDPPATDEEIRAASLQFVRKLSGFTAP